MTLPPGYEVLEKIGEGFNAALFRAYQLRHRRLVILKILTAEHPSIAEIAQLRHEYEITSGLNIEGVLNPLALEQLGYVPILVLEDFSGSPFNNFTYGFKTDLETFLQLAIHVSATLGEIHQNDLIHKHINPGNILFDPDTKPVKITGFGDASRLAGEKLSPDKEGIPEGMLVYISPEQTGRMNRMLDYRTDFYSLGAVFYELLAGHIRHWQDHAKTTLEPFRSVIGFPTEHRLFGTGECRSIKPGRKRACWTCPGVTRPGFIQGRCRNTSYSSPIKVDLACRQNSYAGRS